MIIATSNKEPLITRVHSSLIQSPYELQVQVRMTVVQLTEEDSDSASQQIEQVWDEGVHPYLLRHPIPDYEALYFTGDYFSYDFSLIDPSLFLFGIPNQPCAHGGSVGDVPLQLALFFMFPRDLRVMFL